MTTYFLFDLETAANLTDSKIERFVQSARTGNLKDPAKIEAKIKDHVETCVERAALSPVTGRIVAASWAIVSTTHGGGVVPIYTHVAIPPDKEWELIARISRAWKTSEADAMLGFNIREFDLPFLVGRSIARWVKLDGQLPRPRDYNLVTDFRDFLPEGRLSDWFDECGIAPKKGDGSMVARWVEQDDSDSISEYSKSEMESMCELFSRMNTVCNMRRNGL